MKGKENPLEIHPAQACDNIARFIEDQKKRLNRDGVVIGLSGGLDSAVVAYLTFKGVEKGNIHLLYLPDRDSKKRHRKDAQIIADSLSVPLQIQEISPVLDQVGVYKLLPLRFLPGQLLQDRLVQFGKRALGLKQENLLAERLSPRADSLLAKGNAYINIKHRLRMILLYHYANLHNLMVLGAANRTELLTGTFTQWGCDQCADVMPILHLYRSQVEVLAEYLEIPEGIRNKPADPDVIPGVDDKAALLGSFYTVDHILWGLEHGVPIDELNHKFGELEVTRIIRLVESSRFMRESPVTFEIIKPI